MYDKQSAMPCRLRQIERDEWNVRWSQVEQANMLQSWEYGEAKANAEKWRPLRFLIESKTGEPLALAQVLTRTWPLVGGVARLNRGPLLLSSTEKKQVSETNFSAIHRALQVEAHRQRWWFFYLAPELSEREDNRRLLTDVGYRPRSKIAPWASVRLDLTLDESVLMANLNGKWRNLLRKAQKSGLIIERREGGEGVLQDLLDNYATMQKEKGFSGVSGTLLHQLAVQYGPQWCFDVYLARTLDEDSDSWAGMLVSVVHGDSATYLIGYTNEKGRKTNANYLLLWQALLDAKFKNCDWFDLGGLNENTPKGVAHFKRGLNGKPYNLIGEFYNY